MNVRIADAHVDAECIARLADTIWRDHYPAIIGTAQVDYMLATLQSTAAITREIDNGRHYRLIEDDGGGPIGYFAYDLAPSHVFLSKLYVLPSVQRTGTGSRAIDYLAAAHPGLPIRLTVNKHNLQAIAFYEKSGFRITGPVIADIGRGFVMDDWKMEKSASLTP